MYFYGFCSNEKIESEKVTAETEKPLENGDDHAVTTVAIVHDDVMIKY